MTHALQELLESNRLWAAKTEAERPGFFTGLLAQQAPQYLWIGCADSRVPANELVDLAPGELFVHRNVANVVVHSDLNCLSVIQFATDLLKVAHIIVVGHSGCGGVIAALNGTRVGLADNWIRHVQNVRNRHAEWLDSLAARAPRRRAQRAERDRAGPQRLPDDRGQDAWPADRRWSSTAGSMASTTASCAICR